MDPAGESYLRQEGRGLCIGFYEQPCRPWAVDGTLGLWPELLADDFDKIEDSINFAYKRFPDLERAGVKSVIHGPFTFAPDGNPLVGPVPGMRNYWSACGVMAGFQPGRRRWPDAGAMDDRGRMRTRRHRPWMWRALGTGSPGLYPAQSHRELPKALFRRLPERRTPRRAPLPHNAHVRHFHEMGAVWGQQFGLEVVNYFRPRR